MPSPERPGGQPGEPQKEREHELYSIVSRFAGNQGEERAGRAYFQAQELIFEDEKCDLSAYRFQLERVYHVAVLGEPPSTDTEEKLQAILSQGEIVSIPEDILAALHERRAKAKNLGSWVEGHYRPGKPLDH